MKCSATDYERVNDDSHLGPSVLGSLRFAYVGIDKIRPGLSQDTWVERGDDETGADWVRGLCHHYDSYDSRSSALAQSLHGDEPFSLLVLVSEPSEVVVIDILAQRGAIDYCREGMMSE